MRDSNEPGDQGPNLIKNQHEVGEEEPEPGIGAPGRKPRRNRGAAPFK